MKDKINIKSCIKDFTVFQQDNGYAEICLYGKYSVSCKENYPVIRIIDLQKEKVVLYEKVKAEKLNLWNYKAKLRIGCYRIETGIALTKANYDSRYLARGQIINNIFVGENFIVAGQSNAAGYGKGEIFDMPQYGVCSLKEKWDIASHPLGHFNDQDVCSDFLNSGHSPWLKFGKQIWENTNTPVGIVSTALNGSYISQWQKGQPLFENMIKKAKSTKAKNFLWYQGCSDVFEGCYQNYEERLEKFIKAIKDEIGNINIYIIQIGGTTNENNPDIGWRKIREAQRKIAAKYKAFLIPTYDLINYSDDIHLGAKDNIILAERVYNAYINKEVYSDIEIINNNNLSLKFSKSLSEISKENIKLFNEKFQEIQSKIIIKENCIEVIPKNSNCIKYISLSFGKLYNGKPFIDKYGEVLPYFCLEL